MKKRGMWIVVSAVVVLGLLIGSFGCAATTPATAPGQAPAEKEVIHWKAQTTYSMESAVTLNLKNWIAVWRSSPKGD